MQKVLEVRRSGNAHVRGHGGAGQALRAAVARQRAGKHRVRALVARVRLGLHVVVRVS